MMARRKRRDEYGPFERPYDLYEMASRHGEGSHSLSDIAGSGSASIGGRRRGRGKLAGGSSGPEPPPMLAAMASTSPPGGALSRSVGVPLPSQSIVPSGFGPNRRPMSQPPGVMPQGAPPPVLTPSSVMKPVRPPRPPR